MTRDHSSDPEPKSLSRRSFLKGAGGAAASGVFVGELATGAKPVEPTRCLSSEETLEGDVEVTFHLNGESTAVTVEPRTTLLSAMRDRIGHTAAKSVCEQGNCGACTVLLDDEPVYSCLTLAVKADGREVRTAGGLAEGGELSPVQAAMVDRDGMMCGFCTPGLVMSVTACLEKNPRADEAEVRQACSGNLCRCGTYPHVFQAALDAGRKMVASSNSGSGSAGGGR
jgi:xanthine dehydrogenase YagT iron-sulfur-binding subunit